MTETQYSPEPRSAVIKSGTVVKGSTVTISSDITPFLKKKEPSSPPDVKSAITDTPRDGIGLDYKLRQAKELSEILLGGSTERQIQALQRVVARVKGYTEQTDITHEIVNKWIVDGDLAGNAERIQRNLSAMARLDAKSPGCVRELYYSFGIRNFGNFPVDVLIRQYEEMQAMKRADLNCPVPEYGVVAYPPHPKKGSLFYVSEETFTKLSTVFSDHYNMWIIEADGVGELHSRLGELDKKYGAAVKPAFLILAGHEEEVEKAMPVEEEAASAASDAASDEPKEAFIQFGEEGEANALIPQNLRKKGRQSFLDNGAPIILTGEPRTSAVRSRFVQELGSAVLSMNELKNVALIKQYVDRTRPEWKPKPKPRPKRFLPRPEPLPPRPIIVEKKSSPPPVTVQTDTVASPAGVSSAQDIEYVRTWMAHGEGWKAIAERHMKRMYELENACPGEAIAHTLTERFGFKNFGDYPLELLLHQYKARDDTEKPYGIILYPTFPEDSKKSKISEEQFWEVFTTFTPGYNLRIVETRRETAIREVSRLFDMYGPESAAFAIICGEAVPGGIKFREKDASGALVPNTFKREGRSLFAKSAIIAMSAFGEEHPETATRFNKEMGVRFFASNEGIKNIPRLKVFVDGSVQRRREQEAASKSQ